MTTSANRQITFVEENVTDQAAAVNEAIRQIDARFVPVVLEMDVAALPASAADGEMYLMAANVSGTENNLAVWVADGGYWEYHAPGLVKVVLNHQDGILYAYDSASLVWAPAAPGREIVVDATAARTLSLADGRRYIRHTGASPVVTLDDAQQYRAGMIFRGRHQGTGNLTLVGATGVQINPPYGGTLTIPPGGYYELQMVGTAEADLMGVTL